MRSIFPNRLNVSSPVAGWLDVTGALIVAVAAVPHSDAQMPLSPGRLLKPIQPPL